MWHFESTDIYLNESVATCVSWRSEVPQFSPRWPHILAKPPATPRTVYTALQITGIFHNSSKSWVQYKNPEGQFQCKRKISSEKHFQWKVKRKLITAHQAEAHHSQSKEDTVKDGHSTTRTCRTASGPSTSPVLHYPSPDLPPVNHYRITIRSTDEQNCISWNPGTQQGTFSVKDNQAKAHHSQRDTVKAGHSTMRLTTANPRRYR